MLIVGAGVCAIALGVALGRLGIPYTIVEKNAELGGTWYVNRYPGCGVDTPNHSYSFSFGARNPWTRYFAQREELLDYLKKVALEYDIRKHLRLNTRADLVALGRKQAALDLDAEDADGEETFESTTLVSAIGQLNDPSPAHFKGEEDFKGLTLHSALWSDDIKLDGKHVAVIGTGATAMQLVPSIADRVRRSPSISAPRNGRGRSPAIPIRSPTARSGCSRICRFMCSGIASTCSGAMATACCRSCARTRPGRIPIAP